MEMSVELPTDHRSVADCPRSMERGSPVKLLMRTARGAGGGGSAVLVGPAVVGGGLFTIGAFFLHPAADIIKAAANTATPIWSKPVFSKDYALSSFPVS